MNPVRSATGALVRREAARRAGRFNPALRACMDLGFWVRIAALRRGNIGGTSELLADHRRRAGQITGDGSRMRQNWLRVWDKLEAAGLVLSRRDFARRIGSNTLYCSTIAYQAGNRTDVRRLVADMWRYDPAFAATSRLAQIRTFSIVASLFPDQAHKVLRLRFRAARDGFRR